MLQKTWFVVTLVLAALLLGTTFAHTLEMPAKLQYDGALWLRLQHSLYHAFPTAGGVAEIGTIVTTIGLAYLVRRDGLAFALAIAAAACFVIAFAGVWVFITNAVNAETARWTAQTLPDDWQSWRLQWEYSHLARFALHLVGFGSLAAALLSLTPRPAE